MIYARTLRAARCRNLPDVVMIPAIYGKEVDNMERKEKIAR